MLVVRPISRRSFGPDEERFEAGRSGYPPESVDVVVDTLEGRDSLGSIEGRSYCHQDTVDHQAMADRIASASHVAVLPVQQRHAVLDRVRRAPPDRAHLTVRCRTDVYPVHRT